jgi:hypothetical protein
MKKIVKWIFVVLILPLLRDLLKDILISSFKNLLDLLKQKMSKWKTEEENNASNSEEKEIITNKWNKRMEDVENMKNTMDQSIEKIVEEELKKSEKKVENIQIESGKVKKISNP